MSNLLAQVGRDIGGGISGIGPLGTSGNYTVGATSAGVVDLLNRVISNFVGILTVIGGIYFLFQFIFGAYEWITAGGDSGKLQNAQKKLYNAVIGLIIIIAAIFVADLVGAFLGLDILSPFNLIENVWN